MSRLPIPGADAGNWGSLLNDFLSQSLKSDGTLKDNIITGAALADGSVTSSILATPATPTTNQVLSYDGTSLNWVSLGNAATMNVGTTAGTVAAGNDSRITGAVQASGQTGTVDLSTTSSVIVPAATTSSQAVNLGTGDTRWSAITNVPSVVVSKTANYTAVAGETVLCNAATGTFTVTLPSAATGQSITVKKIDATSNIVTVSGSIDGGANLALRSPGFAWTGRYDGTTWRTISRSHIDSAGSFIIPPASIAASASAETAWFAINRMALMRFVVPHPTWITRVTLGCGTASGNIELAVYSVTRTGAMTFDLTKVASSGVIACPTPSSSSIHVPFATETLLTTGQYALGLWCDNTTATFTHITNNAAIRGGWGLSDGSASVSGAAATISGNGYGSRSFAATIEAALF